MTPQQASVCVALMLEYHSGRPDTELARAEQTIGACRYQEDGTCSPDNGWGDGPGKEKGFPWNRSSRFGSFGQRRFADKQLGLLSG